MEIKLELDSTHNGGFRLYEEDRKIGEIVVDLKDNVLTAYHTEVLPQAEGKGYGRKLLDALADYARLHRLKVKPLCPYVLLQFKRHPEKFEDLWLKL